MKNSKSKILNIEQILMSQVSNSKQFETLRFRIWNLFRISNLEFRISKVRAFSLLIVGVAVFALLSISHSGIGRSPQVIFQEARFWQIAADAPDVLTLRPNATGSVTQLGVVGAGAN